MITTITEALEKDELALMGSGLTLMAIDVTTRLADYGSVIGKDGESPTVRR